MSDYLAGLVQWLLRCSFFCFFLCPVTRCLAFSSCHSDSEYGCSALLPCTACIIMKWQDVHWLEHWHGFPAVVISRRDTIFILLGVDRIVWPRRVSKAAATAWLPSSHGSNSWNATIPDDYLNYCADPSTNCRSSSHPAPQLTACVHAAATLLYPMHWQHIYIPVLPPHLIDYCG